MVAWTLSGYPPVDWLLDADDNSKMNEATKSNHADAKDVPRPVPSSPGVKKHINKVEGKDEKIVSQNVPTDEDKSGKINMEASLTTDDVIRAGGFGARDDISSFLPVASDSTDFEATILDARNYEEPLGEICRHGLGWREPAEGK
ncbi:hypothetical protein GH714_035902 [Hevea brasiliensis]|uniref:Uncharacterized protein n=1 Tax=Hevea brasiliensis TaxID=3981 RepID=A0A6A6M6Y6_HEVBR|nr:hypothetical protein GH714_035902 [Hevea brasiliensis]